METSLLLLIAAAFAIMAVIWLVLTYNGLVAFRQRFLNAFAQIDVQLKRRYDLIPNLVESVKGYMAHERQTLEAVIGARNAAVTASLAANAEPTSALVVGQLVGAESALMAALGRFQMLAEAYPELKADRAVAGLMEELTSTENRVAFARQAYNDSVATYNSKRLSFPTTLVASLFGFAPAALFQIDDAAQRQVVDVDLATK